ncbi:VWA domain-containing protein [Mycobacterium sp. 1274761.0]|uniref:vWA domain-containing protein n=1 Tax=Mycobacterium sp. 1274761.0 TaxID=1834077 RepID=UPI001E5C498A|nr:VWA domain-containing protein [Mycobacterium sp. 1274761.0]
MDRLAVIFARRLRAEGMAVPTGSVALFVSALSELDPAERDSLYWAGRSALVKRPEDIETYDRVFRSVWLDQPRDAQIAVTAADGEAVDDQAGAEDDREHRSRVPVTVVRYSSVEVLRRKDFSEYSPADFSDAQRLMADLRATAAMRRSRRRRPAKLRRRTQPDIRATVRRALRTGGEPIRRAWYAPTLQPRRLVLLCDVSGSMDLYSRALLRFMHAAVVSRRAVEAFTMGTRLTRLTRELLSRDPDQALRRASASVSDWSGGTRLGDTLREYNDEWGMRGMSRGAVVVILSDGWERGDPTAVAEQMARLSRVAHKVVWVNPLKASPGYAPLARGMAAALPYIDNFIEGHNLNALDDLVKVISE